MIRRRAMVLLFLGVVLISTATVRSVARQDPSSGSHIAWVINALRRMQTIKPGMTRGDLLTVFTTEGGLSTRTSRTYVSRDCPYFKVDVQFKPVDQPNQQDDDVMIDGGARDIIVTMSRPYLEFGITD